ncbi:nSTAND1 domain-containing NTPase [Ornithinimicrobium avium]|nr:helix-turn-helix domain-containing protein [Ornithinimicrobium avium]
MAQAGAADTPQDFARDLTAARLRAGLSVRDVARATGVPPATLGGYFSGRHLPPTTRPEVLAAVLGAIEVPTREHPAWRRRLLSLHDRRRQPVVTRAPYPGLRAFDTKDHDLFFGRDTLVERLLSVVQQVVDEPLPVVMVVGPSGAGKSSVLRAGLLATLPSGAGSLTTPTALEEPPGDEEGQPDQVPTVLVVDQLEELWTHPTIRAHADRTLDQLVTWAQGAPGRVLVLGLRADFFGEAMHHPALGEALEKRQVLVGPLGGEQLRAAIEEPARRVGLALEPGLVDVILADVREDNHGSPLPHLAQVLETMWQAGDRKALTVQDYHRAGGLEGAIRQSAEAALASLPAEQHALAMTVLLRMVTGSAQGWTRRLVPTAEIVAVDEDARSVLERLVDRRLVTVGKDVTTLSHESLVEAWPRLRDAVEARRGDLARRDSLERVARDWDDDGRDDDHLLRGSRLVATSEWAATAPEQLTALQQEFLDTSRRLDKRTRAERRGARRRLQGLLAVMAVLLVVASAAGLSAVRASDSARLQRDQAQSRQMAVAAANQRALDPGLSQQLAVAAYRAADTRESRSAVLDATTSPVISAWSVDDAVLERSATVAGGEHLVLSGPSGGVRVVRAHAGEFGWDVVAAVTGFGDSGRTPVVSRLVPHPDEPWVVVAGTSVLEGSADEPLLMLLDLADPTEPRLVPIEIPARPTAAAFVDGGRVLVVADQGGLLHRYEVVPPAADAPPDVRVAEPAEDDLVDSEPPVLVEALAASRDGSVLAAALDSGTVRAWSVDDGRLHPAGSVDTGRGLFDLDMTADGSAVAAVGRSGLVHWLALEGQHVTEVGTTYASDTNLFTVQVDDGSGLLVTSGWDGTVTMWRFDAAGPLTDTPALVLPVPRPVLDMTVAGGRWLFATLDGTTYTWDSAGAALPRLSGNVFMVDASVRGERMMTSTGPPDGAVTVWDAADPHAPRSLHVLRADDADVSTGAGALRDDGGAAAMGTTAGRLLAWDVTGVEAVRTVDLQVSPEGVVLVLFVPDDGSVLAFGRSGTLVRVDVDGPDAGRIVDETRLSHPTLTAALREDGLLAVADDTGRVHLLDVDDLGSTTASFGPGPSVYGLDFSPDGEQLALSMSDESVRLYDVTDPASPAAVGDPLTGPTSILNSVKYSPDGQRLAVAAIGGSAWLYERSGEGWTATETLRAGLVNLQDVAWSADGSVLLGGALSGQTRLWLTDVETAVRTVCAGVGQDITREEWEGLLPGTAFEPPCVGGG